MKRFDNEPTVPYGGQQPENTNVPQQPVSMEAPGQPTMNASYVPRRRTHYYNPNVTQTEDVSAVPRVQYNSQPQDFTRQNGAPRQGFVPQSNMQPRQGFVPPQPPVPPQADGFDDFDYEPVGDEKKPSSAPMIVAIISAVVVVLALSAFFAYIFFFHKDDNAQGGAATAPQTTAAATTENTQAATQAATQTPVVKLIEVPALAGLSEADAYKALNKAGAQYTVSREFSDTVAAGYVIRQSPEAGAEISKSDVVTVYVSKGKDEIVTEPPTTKPGKESDKESSKESDKESSAASASSDDFILPDSNIRKLSKSELRPLSRTELNLALNEIFARRGRIFKDPELSAYFNSKSWYKGTVPADSFDSTVTLNEYESYNVSLISGYQAELGYR